jgi:hypothetical protein
MGVLKGRSPFAWVKGAALYTENFTVSNTYPTLTNNYVLLLKANEFTGTVTNNGVSTIQNVPPINNPPIISNRRSLIPLFTNNAQVYYKSGSLPSCGVGSVRNSSFKSRKT